MTLYVSGALRMETCVRCGKRWNVSVDKQLPPSGYICPHCVSRERWPWLYAVHSDAKKAPVRSDTSDRRTAPNEAAS